MLNFLNKWGLLIILLLTLSIFINTCGVKSHTERLERKITSLEKSISQSDSLDRKLSIINAELITLETALRIVYDQNTVVRTSKRPDDVMNEYNSKIKELQQKRESLNASRK